MKYFSRKVKSFLMLFPILAEKPHKPTFTLSFSLSKSCRFSNSAMLCYGSDSQVCSVNKMFIPSSNVPSHLCGAPVQCCFLRQQPFSKSKVRFLQNQSYICSMVWISWCAFQIFMFFMSWVVQSTSVCSWCVWLNFIINTDAAVLNITS